MRTETNCIYVEYLNGYIKKVSSHSDWFKDLLNFYIIGNEARITKPADNPGHKIYTPIYNKGIRYFLFEDNGYLPEGKYYFASTSTEEILIIPIHNSQTYAI